jgi:hypothetical protein
VGADNLLKTIDWATVEVDVSVWRIQWKFNPPTAFGGGGGLVGTPDLDGQETAETGSRTCFFELRGDNEYNM